MEKNYPGKLIIAQFVKKNLLAFYATWMFISVLTTAFHSFVFWARWNQCTPSYHTLRSINQIGENIDLFTSSYILICRMFLRVFNYIWNTKLNFIVNTRISLFLSTDDGKMWSKILHMNLAQWKKFILSKYFLLWVRFLWNSMTRFGKDNLRCS